MEGLLKDPVILKVRLTSSLEAAFATPDPRTISRTRRTSTPSLASSNL